MFRLPSTFPAKEPRIHRRGAAFLAGRREVPVLAVPDPRPGGGLGLLDNGAPVMEEYGAPGLMKTLLSSRIRAPLRSFHVSPSSPRLISVIKSRPLITRGEKYHTEAPSCLPRACCRESELPETPG